MNELDVVLSSRVRLARNYEDLPFDLGEKPDSAAMCVARTVQALRLEEQAWLTLTEEEQAALPRMTHKFSTALRQALEGRDN